MPVQENVYKYLLEFSEWLAMAEEKLAKAEKKFKLEQQSKGKIPSTDLLKLINKLRKRIDYVTTFLTEHKDLADTFCKHAEKLLENLSKTLQSPRSLSPKVVSGLQTLQKTVLSAIFSLTKSFKSALSTHHSEQHEEKPVTLVHHQDTRPKQHFGAKPHLNKTTPQREQRRHSFNRTGKE